MPLGFLKKNQQHTNFRTIAKQVSYSASTLENQATLNKISQSKHLLRTMERRLFLRKNQLC